MLKKLLLYGYVVAGIVAIVLAAGFVIDHVDEYFADDDSDVGRCGPHHHWKNNSCEMDRSYKKSLNN